MNEARWFAALVGVGTLVVLTLPILFSPLRWARVFTWHVEPSDNRPLGIYFARCLGAVGVGLSLTMLAAAWQNEFPRLLFLQAAMAGGLLAIVHLVGAIEKRQPPIETFEILVYAGLSVWALRIYFLLG